MNNEIQKLLDYLDNTKMKDNTIVILTSDHGDLLGSHGYMHQKWYNMYQEVIHVPLFIRWPKKIKPGTKYESISSHVDIIPTILGFCNIKNIENQLWYKNDFYNSQPLVGMDLSKYILNKDLILLNNIAFFMTNDNIAEGLGINDFLGMPPNPIEQPTSIYSIVVNLNLDKYPGIWKYACYIDAKSLWSNPPIYDDQVITYKYLCINDKPSQRAINFCPTTCTLCSQGLFSACVTRSVKFIPIKNQYEMYYLTEDPLELNNYIYLIENNLASLEIIEIRKILQDLLIEQFNKKALSPVKGPVPGAVTAENLFVNL